MKDGLTARAKSRPEGNVAGKPFEWRSRLSRWNGGSHKLDESPFGNMIGNAYCCTYNDVHL